jgi:hypothetical protein
MLPPYLRGNLTLSDRFHWTLDFVCRHFNADLGILIPCRFRYADMNPATHGFSVEVWDSPRFAFMRSLVLNTCNTPIATLTSDAQPDYHHDIARSIGLHSLLCAPIRGTVKPHAVICLQRRLTAAPFTPDDLDELETIALLVARELDATG